jgi:protein TonB
LYTVRLAAFLIVSVVAHVLLAAGLDRLPAEPPPRRELVFVSVAPPPPAPEPEPEPTPPPPPPTVDPNEVVHEAPAKPQRPRPRTNKVPPPDTPPRDVAATERPALPGEVASDTPVFGFSLESTSQAGQGPAMPVGNTLQQPQSGPSQAPKALKPLAAPVPAYEVSKMPTMRERCEGKYTDEARRAGIEGTVVLDLIVGLDGRTRDIRVVQGLGHGLDEAAIEALRDCQFSPGERDGSPVAVRVRTFKIRFFLEDE